MQRYKKSYGGVAFVFALMVLGVIFLSFLNEVNVLTVYNSRQPANSPSDQSNPVTMPAVQSEYKHVYECGALDLKNVHYVLKRNIRSARTCLNITAENVTFDGNGFLIKYNWNPTDFSRSYGIVVQNTNNAVIRNARVTTHDHTGFHNYGIFLAGGSGHLVENSKVNTGGHHAYGLRILESTHNTIKGNYFETFTGPSTTGIRIDDGSYNHIIDNHFSINAPNSRGITLQDASNNNVMDGNYILLNGDNQNAAYRLGEGYSTVIKNSIVKVVQGTVLLMHATDSGPLVSNVKVIRENPGVDLLVVGSLSNNGTVFEDTYFESYVLGPGIWLTYTNSDSGSINFLKPVNGSGNNLSSDIQIRQNFAYVNPVDGLNKEAKITLYNPRNFAYSAILKNGLPCLPSVCNNYTSLSADTVIFGVTGWSNYTLGNEK